MPKLIEHIDAIARQKQRDVLFIVFHPADWGDFESDSCWGYDYSVDPRRAKVLAWLDEHGITWQECGPVASTTSFRSYLGEVYIDIPFDEADELYCLVRNYLENPDGTMRDENVRFYYLPLEIAMKNAHHDEPGFWDRWAEEF
ncbi:hypothetical protein [Geobacter pickeringii]|uniref:Uncharacterized protein n=1 Tax=Geobacter pickeringii TaxID=345632 RepID=A0A0B5BEI6_9BACT|nr:hypothetical protein [Geobacter pickeringii]AJE03574.1 hypothetical protein GPICK_09610 [Geobacter pickeringii]